MLSENHVLCFPKRYTVTILAFIGSMMLSILRTNISINLVEMTSDKNITVGCETRLIKADYDWSPVEKGYVLGSFSLGLLFAFLGGPVVNQFGGATSFGVATLLSAILTVLCPALLQVNLFLFLFARVLEGVFAGITFAAFVDIFAHWAPPAERTRIVSCYLLGYYVGAGVNYPISGIVAHRLGWRAVFYLSGGVAFVWSLIWLSLVGNTPADDKFISEVERSFLKTEIANMTNEKVPVPWKKIMTCKPVWAILNEYFTVYWSVSFVVYCLPLYIKDIYHVNTEQVGMITSLPMWCSILTMPIAAYLADYLRTNHFTPAKVHKIFIFWGNTCVVVLLFLSAVWKNPAGSVICFCLMRISFSFADTSYSVICIDMAGQFSSIIKGISKTFSGLSTLLNPLVMGFMVSHHSLSEYNNYFLFLGFISMYGVIVFLMFGSGELQPWAVLPDKQNELELNASRTAETPSRVSDVGADKESPMKLNRQNLPSDGQWENSWNIRIDAS